MAPGDVGEADRGIPAGPLLEGVGAGARVGPYRIVRVLGEGGMGVVYLAEQLEPIRREVALKVLRSGADSAQVIARFEAERQALAVMDHPSITKVHDAGATPGGVPYFVMERVDGVPLTDHATARRLGSRARVRLFTQVCRAVQHAHQKGLIHRDLKPSNVLVTEADGAPLCKVIDFGIARAVERLPDAPQITQTGLSLGTPAYMSPEQVFGSGLDIDTRADIYALGVMLYELLAGALPFEPEEYRGLALMAQHATKDPPAPAARVAAMPPERRARVAAERGCDSAELVRELSGELGWIVLRALEQERERRYETANALAEDLERFLAHEPVLAAAPSRVYRARKFARRHRPGVAFAATVAALLVGVSILSTVQSRRVARARAIAETRQGQAEELIGFMLGDLRAKLTPLGRLDVLDEVGSRAIAYFAAVPDAQLSDEELFRRSQALRQLGEVRVDQGELGAAMDAFRQSLALATGLAARDPANGEWQVGLGAGHFWVGLIHWRQGALDSALAHFTPYLRVSEALVARAPDSLDYRLELSYAHSNIGSVREAQGDLAGALAAFRATLAINRELVARDTSNAQWRLDLAQTHNSIAVVQRKLGDLAGAAASHRAELALKEALVARDAENRQWQRQLAITRAYLGNLLLARGDVSGARAALEGALALHASLAATDPSNAERRRSVANSEQLLARVLLEEGDARGAMALLRASRARLVALLAGSPDNRQWRQELARTQTAAAQALLALGRSAEALAAATAALDATAPARNPDDPAVRQTVCEALLRQGDALAASGDAESARRAWTRAHATVDSLARASGHTDLLALTATALLALDRRDDAAPLVRELLRRGYRRPTFLALARAREVIAAS